MDSFSKARKRVLLFEDRTSAVEAAPRFGRLTPGVAGDQTPYQSNCALARLLLGSSADFQRASEIQAIMRDLLHQVDLGAYRMKLFTTGVIISLTFAVGARGDIVLDQQHSFTSSIANSTNGDVTQIGQTFTVGIAGTLDHIDVLMFRLGGIFDPTGAPLLRVFNTAGGFPTGAPLATVTLPKDNVPLNNAAFVSYDVSSAAIGVNIGEVLAFSVTATSGVGPYFLWTDQGQFIEYEGGAAIVSYGSGPWQQLSPPQDHGFRTYMLANVVEELFGDYNDGQVIDAADYIVWRKTLAAGGTTLLHDATPGVVNSDDYNYWRAHYGDTLANGAGNLASTSVPEPATSVMLIVAVAGWGLRRQQSAQRAPRTR
jgi:hypothetical protein